MTTTSPTTRVVFLVKKQPKSLQANGNNSKYRAIFGDAAKPHVKKTPQFDGDALYLRIVYFFRKDIRIDIDNIIKPISDGMKEIVYKDDGAIVKCAAEKVDLGSDYTLESDTLPEDRYMELLNLVGGSDEHFLLIEVGNLDSRDISFGAIDERRVRA